MPGNYILQALLPAGQLHALKKGNTQGQAQGPAGRPVSQHQLKQLLRVLTKHSSGKPRRPRVKAFNQKGGQNASRPQPSKQTMPAFSVGQGRLCDLTSAFGNTGLEPPASRFAAWSEKLNTRSPAQHSVQATPAARLNVQHGPTHPPNLRSRRGSHPLRHQGKAVHHKERSDATVSQIAKLARQRYARSLRLARTALPVATQNANFKGRSTRSPP